MASPAVVKFNGQVLLDSNDGQGNKINLSDNEPSRSTYSLFITGYVPPATPTDIITIIPGAKLARVKSIVIAGTATAASNIILQLIRRSAANTGGTLAAQTAVSRDSQNDAATAAVSLYSVKPTGLGTSLGSIDGQRLNLSPAANGGIDRALFQFSWINDQAITLRPSPLTEILAINLGGAAWPAGGALDISIMWTEE